MKELSNVDFLVGQLLPKQIYSGYKGGSFGQTRSCCSLQVMPGKVLVGCRGRQQVTASAIPPRSTDNTQRPLSRSNALPAFIKAAR